MLAFSLGFSWGSCPRFARTSGSLAASFRSDQGWFPVAALAGMALRGVVLEVPRVNETASLSFSGPVRCQENS